MTLVIALKIIGTVFISAGSFIYLLIYLKFRSVLSIRAITIHLQKPILSPAGETIRKPLADNKALEALILKENISRRLAYKNTSIKTGEAFFNDSDMVSDYYLIVVYDKRSNVPLLTARYYFNKSVIARCLAGDEGCNQKPQTHGDLDLDKLKEGEIFLADRLSGNTASSVYRRYRNYIFLLFYSEIMRHNKNSRFILMARKEKHEKLLKKYLSLGLKVIGSNRHKEKEHWILLGDLKNGYSHLKSSTLLSMILFFKKPFPDIKN